MSDVLKVNSFEELSNIELYDCYGGADWSYIIPGIFGVLGGAVSGNVAVVGAGVVSIIAGCVD